MNLFIFFVLPLATILLSIVLQKILRSPILVAITFFAIYLIVAFVSFSDTLAEAIIAVIIYTVIAYITANIVMAICCLKRRNCNNEEQTRNNLSYNNMINSRFINPYEIENNSYSINNSFDNINQEKNISSDVNHYVTTSYRNSAMNRNNIQRKCYR